MTCSRIQRSIIDYVFEQAGGNMVNLLALFGKKDDIETAHKPGILTRPGDRLEARITRSNRQVVKIQTDNGNSKHSATRYPNGTVVETTVTKPK